MVKMGGLFSTIIDKTKRLLKRSWPFHHKMTRCAVKTFIIHVLVFFLPHEFHGYRLTPVGPLLSVGLEVGIHHDSFEHHIEA